MHGGKQSQAKSFSSRFIPNRNASHLNTFDKLTEATPLGSTDEELTVHSLVRPLPAQNFLQYSAEKNNKENLKLTNFATDELYQALKFQRQIPKRPVKVLDAPSLQDDFYLNLLDWSSSNVLAVGLSSAVYLWNATNSRVNKLCDLGFNDSVTSVAWAANGQHIAVGTNQGTALLWDAASSKLVRSFTGHSARIGSMAWNGNLLSTGSRDRQILHRDLRAPGEFVSRLAGHKQEVCGLKWSFDEQQLSSGGNDNRLVLWNLHSCSPVNTFQHHVAAVKALAWSPHQHGLLVSGGGTADRTIRFWNTLTGEHVSCTDTGSQVCNLIFSKNSKELVSTHGYSLNQIFLWNHLGTNKLATLTGHTFRVLFLGMSPEGQTIVTGAGDETLRFWDVFPSSGTTETENSRIALFPSFEDLR